MELEATPMGCYTPYRIQVDIFGRDYLENVMHFVKGFLHGGWFIYKEYHLG